MPYHLVQASSCVDPIVLNPLICPYCVEPTHMTLLCCSHSYDPYFKICITREVKADLTMWLNWLHDYNGKTILYRSPITESNAINLYSDASGLAYRATYGSNWPANWASMNIAVLELYPTVLLIQLFGHKMANSRVLFHCDNSAIVEVIK